MKDLHLSKPKIMRVPGGFRQPQSFSPENAEHTAPKPMRTAYPYNEAANWSTGVVLDRPPAARQSCCCLSFVVARNLA
jgi:hypothetical protein